jgi:hypothetical protein
MNQPDDYMFFSGLGVIVLSVFFVIAGIAFEYESYQTSKNKNQNK